MQQFDVISLDFNELPMQILTFLKKETSQEITEQEDIVHDHLVKSQENIAQVKEEIKQMKREQKEELMERTKAFKERQWLEKVISVASEEITDIAMDMFMEAKVVQLDQIVTELKKDNKELREHQIPSTPPKQVE